MASLNTFTEAIAMSLPPLSEATTLDLYGHLKACSRRKMSIAAYAKANNIPAHRLYEARKRQKLNKRATLQAPSAEANLVPNFVTVSVAPTLPSLSIVINGTIELRLNEPLSPEQLAALIKALRA